MSYNKTAALAARDQAAMHARHELWHVVEPLPDERWLHLVLGPHHSGWEIVVMWTDEGAHITASHLAAGTFEIAAAGADDIFLAIREPRAIPSRATIDLRDDAS